MQPHSPEKHMFPPKIMLNSTSTIMKEGSGQHRATRAQLLQFVIKKFPNCFLPIILIILIIWIISYLRIIGKVYFFEYKSRYYFAIIPVQNVHSVYYRVNED